MSHPATTEDLRLMLGRYEAAVQESVNEGGDENEAELEAARKDLLTILRQAKVTLPEPAPESIPDTDGNPDAQQKGPADQQPCDCPEGHPCCMH